MGGPRPYFITFADLDGEPCPFFVCVHCGETITPLNGDALVVWKNYEKPQMIILHKEICYDAYFKRTRSSITIYSMGLGIFLDQLVYNTRKAVPLIP